MRVTLTLAIVFLTSYLPARIQTPADTNNAKLIERFLAEIKGREQQPAGQVFKNVNYLKDDSAATLLDIMDIGYARALGVSCTYCHVEQDFSADDKRPKRAAREMQVMHRSFNEQLRKMVNSDRAPDARLINCNSCHRGRAVPQR